MKEDHTEDDRRLIVAVREHLRWSASRPPTPWHIETMGLIRGTLHRVWHPNPEYMTPGEPVGHWTTEKR